MIIDANVNAIGRLGEMADNDHNHRVAASDFDFRFGPDGNSGALFCYLPLSVSGWQYTFKDVPAIGIHDLIGEVGRSAVELLAHQVHLTA